MGLLPQLKKPSLPPPHPRRAVRAGGLGKELKGSDHGKGLKGVRKEKENSALGQGMAPEHRAGLGRAGMPLG